MKRCLTLLFIIACMTRLASAATTAPVTKGQDFILCYSNTIQGETEPCG